MPTPKMYTGHELGFVHSRVGKPGKEVSRMSLTLIADPVVRGKGVMQERIELFMTDRQCRDLLNELEGHLQELAAWG